MCCQWWRQVQRTYRPSITPEAMHSHTAAVTDDRCLLHAPKIMSGYI